VAVLTEIGWFWIEEFLNSLSMASNAAVVYQELALPLTQFELVGVAAQR
jgi:hypothetical protein